MRDERLQSYLNDHLAGALAGAELAKQVLAHHPDDSPDTLLYELIHELQEDQTVLNDVLSRLGVQDELAQKAKAWLREKANAINSRKRHEQLEAVALGVRGKLTLWMALEAAYGSDDRLSDVDFKNLQERAHRQYHQLESYRVRAFPESSISDAKPVPQLP